MGCMKLSQKNNSTIFYDSFRHLKIKPWIASDWLIHAVQSYKTCFQVSAVLSRSSIEISTCQKNHHFLSFHGNKNNGNRKKCQNCPTEKSFAYHNYIKT